MNKYSIYFGGLPCSDNTQKGKIYNSIFLSNIKINSLKRIRIYISKNIRHKEKNFEDYLFEFNPLDNFDEIQPYLIENFRNRLLEVYNPINLVKHTYNLFNNLDGVIAA